MKPTIGLCIITKSYTDAAVLVKNHKDDFDEIYVQINGPVFDYPTKGTLPWIKGFPYKWNNNFADARNALLAEVKTDFWFWIDTDDTVEGAENLRDVVAQMDQQGVDRMFALYEYSKNDLGEEIAPHWRERIIRTAHPYKWVGAVHETLLSDRREVSAKTEAITVIHHKDQKDYEASIKRNHKILLSEYKKEPRDPRITMYLGLSLFTQHKWAESTEKLIEHITTSGSLEDQYRSWLKIAECHAQLGELHKSISACHEALKLLPQFPDAYLGLAQFYYQLEDYNRCLEWLKLGVAKPQPETFAITDPTLKYRTVMMGALAEFQRGRIEAAWELINHVKDQSPDYKLVKEYYPIFEEAWLESQAIKHAKWLVSYTATKKGGRPGKVFEAIGSLALDVRLNAERNKVSPPKQWPDKSIVFFCGQTVQTWGPDTLGKGMGGSEEAVVYLSRELVRRGWDVTVYCERDDEYIDPVHGTVKLKSPDFKLPLREAVRYLPWHTLNPKDTFDVFVAWRIPEAPDGIKARLVLCDLHDVVEPERVEKAVDYVDKFMVKSRYHRSLFPKVPDDRFAVVSNGILRSQFGDEVTKRMHSAGYFSSYDRGLECLLDMWPKIRERVPDATLDIYYGWHSFDSFHHSNPVMMKWRYQMTRKLYDLQSQGVTEHGRVDHQTLANAMKEIQVWAYPTEFTEINCITALKAQEAGMIPVTTACYALEETVVDNTFSVSCTDIYTNETKQAEYIQTIAKALRSGHKVEPVSGVDWTEITDKWEATCALAPSRSLTTNRVS